MNKNSKVFSKVYVGIIIALIYIPMLSMIIFSFNSGKSLDYGKVLVLLGMVNYLKIGNFFQAITNTFSSNNLNSCFNYYWYLAAISLSKNKKVFREAVMD